MINTADLPSSIVFDVTSLAPLEDFSHLQNFLDSLKGLTKLTLLLNRLFPFHFTQLCRQISEMILLKFALPGEVMKLEQFNLPFLNSLELRTFGP